MKNHNKLVRSKILKILDAQGIPYIAHMANPEEYKEKVYEKLVEEVAELIADPCLEELADVLEVIEVIKVLNTWSTEQVETVRLKKHEERGGFDQPIILEES